MNVITFTVWLTMGLTFYGGPTEIDDPLKCGGTFTHTEGYWAAVPIEWLLNGDVACGDMLHVEFKNGTRLKVPIRDTGCHLHWSVWDSDYPMGADFPFWLGREEGVATGTGRIRVRHKDGTWWTPPDTIPWENEYCRVGPLTVPRPSESLPQWH